MWLQQVIDIGEKKVSLLDRLHSMQLIFFLIFENILKGQESSEVEKHY